ncbi:sensor histidine kinase [Paenibacillus sedimenti]|uniref:histidine kinase n=1 Tax=Paenibacillus sedimenti TaxID=2770274 RepID=A0A926QIY5_9BACL|nr:sensor histidine kinase [Paenibacillus sedimenti]MBD0379974.1 sensor histidine kinase [Paenibacillus sedimenti]
MTIRMKLLLFIPLLVLLTNSVAFFLFQNTKIVQKSYDVMMDRILVYKQSVQYTDDSLRTLYGYLLHATEEGKTSSLQAQAQLKELRSALVQQSKTSPHGSDVTGYIHMLDTFMDQEHASLEATGLRDKPSDALTHYMDAEKTASFIRDEGQRLVDLELSYYQPIYREIQQENKRMNRWGLAVFIVNTVMSIVVAVWISRSVTGPVSRLVGTAQRISKGNLHMDPLPSRSSDELGILSDVFSQMVSNLKVLMAKEKANSEKDRLVKELELQALQSQINPHFLFNSLNVLSKMALLEGAEQTSDLIVSMSSLIRYRLSKLDAPVTLREELNHVRQYVSIQQARFRDRIRFVMDIDEYVLQTHIPALTVQPLVENAFVHGIEGMEQGAVIRLEISRDADYVRITVSDNGTGMREEVRQALLKLEPGNLGGDDNKPSTGLGTRNVFKRLQIFYDRTDLVEIQSEAGKGTAVTLRIPLERSSD